jgi:membrane-associated phospholipid phosphatase
MPWADIHGAPPTFLESLVPLYHADIPNTGAAVAEAVTLPGQVVVSFVLVAAAAEALRRRGRPEAAAGWLAAWALGTAVEVVCKQVVVRPALHRAGVHLIAFDSSWPSGHALRAGIVAGALGAAWPRARPLIACWYAAVVALLVTAGFHTPSDVVGGMLLAALLGVGVVLLERSAWIHRDA